MTKRHFVEMVQWRFPGIPEGIAIAIPCLAARPDSPWLAFGLASLSGLAEPLGAVVALSVLHGSAAEPITREVADASAHHHLPRRIRPGRLLLEQISDMDNVLAFVAGIMITVAVTELFPEAKRHMTHDKVPGVAGTIIGIVVMLASDAYLDT